MTQRIEFIDTARGIAMLCIVLGHIGFTPFTLVVYTFHVPVFYVISGWFVSCRLGPGPYAKRRARTLLVPYAATCLVLWVGMVIRAAIIGDGAGSVWEALAHWPQAALYAVGGADLPTLWPVGDIGAIWFLWACFWGIVGLRVLLELKQEWLRALIVLALALAGIFTAKLCFLPLGLQPGCVALAYMYVGYLARTYAWPRVQAWPRSVKAGLAVLAAAVWVSYVIYRDRIMFMSAEPGLHWWSIFGILAGCATVIILSWLLTKASPRLARPFMFLGRYSLIMLCVHVLEMWFFDYTALANAMMAAGVPFAVAGGLALALKLAIICTCTWLLSKWNPARRLFGFPPLEHAAQ